MRRVILLLCLVLSTGMSAQSLADLYEQVNSSVVVINVVSVAPENVGNQVELVAMASAGSGVLVNDQGLIWTAAHVVQSAEVVEIQFLDGDVYEGTVVTSNTQADVALVKINSGFQLKNKHIAKIGDSDKLRVGDDVMVLGAPHGFKQSLSRGILSGRYRPESLMNDFINIEFLQTDAAINPGNSGGPMFNMKGEVVGIASRIYTSSGGFDGIGFAMSSNVAKTLLTGNFNDWSGIQSMLIGGTLAAALNVPQESGLLVISVSSKGTGRTLKLRGGYIPANINGTEVLIGGDVILEIGGIKVTDNNSLFQIRQKLVEAKKGESLSISILRNGQIGTATFTKN